ncbi:MAG TPA: Rpn family recombination-promoting nuclease/putative transposase [Candidatus Atribacteria bacterium]|nr:Rpn family recombination-promoting nuclease/putative transposase [Candidatus Atribacteria bacterium]
MKFADPKNDLAFKKIFGDESRSEVLISFLNSILNFKGSKLIKKATIANPYQVPQIKDLKESIVDVKAINEDNEEFIVEMQVERDKNFAKRSLYYSSKSYINQIDRAEQYPLLKKVYFIGILDFAIFDTKDYISRHLILDEKTLKQEMKDFEFNFIELDKFKLKLSQCDTVAKKWIYFIQNADSFDLIPKEYEEIREFRIAFDIAKKYNWSKEELEWYDRISLKIGSNRSVQQTYYEDGIKQGIKQGIEKGREEGIKQGIEKGIEQEKLNIAKNLLDVLDDETISKKTDLSIDTIQKLRLGD